MTESSCRPPFKLLVTEFGSYACNCCPSVGNGGRAAVAVTGNSAILAVISAVFAANTAASLSICS